MKWNQITWYSRLGAIIIFIGIIPAVAFFVGSQYGRLMQLQEDTLYSVDTAPIMGTPAPGELPTLPADVPMGKINIGAVCEGALSYMSFIDGASADAFVAECKEGKHPEVIEKFKADLNLGDGVAI